MTCLIYTNKAGHYVCQEAPQSRNELRHLDLNEGALILTAAHLPPTPVLMKVGSEWVESAYTIGGEVPTVTICEPGCYKLPLQCEDFEGLADPDAPVQLCYEVVKDFDKTAFALAQLSAGTGADVNDQLLACLEELKVLAAASNDSAALASIVQELEKVCDKLLASNAEAEQANVDQLACLEQIKASLEIRPLIPLGTMCYT